MVHGLARGQWCAIVRAQDSTSIPSGAEARLWRQAQRHAVVDHDLQDLQKWDDGGRTPHTVSADKL